MTKEAASIESAPLRSASAATADETAAMGSSSGAGSRQEAPDREQSPDNRPMSGLRVIDVGTFLAGPYAASMLGEFGAEILKRCV